MVAVDTAVSSMTEKAFDRNFRPLYCWHKRLSETRFRNMSDFHLMDSVVDLEEDNMVELERSKSEDVAHSRFDDDCLYVGKYLSNRKGIFPI